MTPSERRLHPASLLFSLGSQIRSLLIPGLFLLVAARSARWQVWVMLMIIPYTLVSVVRYLGYRYRFDADEIVIKTGLVFRNERHIPYARIHNIGSVQNPLHRILRVAEVRVETGGGQEPEARIQVLSLTALEEMRERVREEKRRALLARPGVTAGRPASAGSTVGVSVASPADAPESRTLLHLSLSDQFLYGITVNRGMVVVAALAGIAWELGWFGGDDSLAGAFTIHLPWNTVARYATSVVALAAAVLTFLVAVRVLSVGWAIVKLHDFTLRIAGGDLATRCGLFTQVTTLIPLHRVQVVSVIERPLQRLIGRAEISVDIAGGGSQEEAVAHRRLAPLIRRDEVSALLREVLPGFELEGLVWQPIDLRAWRRLLKIHLFFSTMAAAVCVLNAGPWGAIVLIPLLPFSWLNSRLIVRSIGYAVAPGFVAYRSGWVRPRVNIARYSKIQALTLAESPFDRRWGMAGLRVDTAGAGDSGRRIHIPYLEKRIASGLYQTLAAAAARTAFRW